MPPEQTERLWRLSSFVLAYEAEEKEYDAPEQPGRRRVSSALAGEAEKDEAGCSGASAQAECRHTLEKEPIECPDRHSPEEEAVEEEECPDSPEEEAVEEAECPDSPEEEEEEAEASSSEG